MRTPVGQRPTGFDKFVRNKFGRTERSGLRPKGRTLKNRAGYIFSYEIVSGPIFLEINLTH